MRQKISSEVILLINNSILIHPRGRYPFKVVIIGDNILISNNIISNSSNIVFRIHCKIKKAVLLFSVANTAKIGFKISNLFDSYER